MSQITAETRFIHLCLQDDRLSDPSSLAAAAAAVANWDELLDLAAQHRVAAYVQAAATACGVELPAAAAERLRSLTFVSRARALLIERLLVQIAGLFDGAGISLIVLKGPALARTLYPQASLRAYDDLDLVVQAQAEPQAIEVLRAAGFEELPDVAEDDWHKRAGAVTGGAPFHRRFVAPGLPVIELHIDPLQLGLIPACEAERWRRSILLPGFPGARMLGPEDQLVQLTVHAHKHGYNRLIWLKDIDLLLRAQNGRIDWSLVQDAARREGVTAAVWYTLQLSVALFQSPATSACFGRLRPSPIVRTLYRRIWPLDDIIALRGQMHRRAVQFRPADAWRGSIPSLILMGRRGDRARAGLSATARRLSPRLAHNR